MSGEIVLSVIVIGRNEELHIQRCLRSIVKALRGIENSEILYVDSASSDRSIALAKQFSIRILQLKPDWHLSAAAGRFIGTLNSSGRYLFFVDADTVIFSDWISQGINYLQKHPEAAAVAGDVHEVFVNPDGKVQDFLKSRYGELDHPRSERTLGGIALYRRSVLDQTGSFNPYVSVDEERELGFRIRREGHTMIRIPESMAITYGPPRETVNEILRRFHTRLYTFGTTLRYCQQNGFARRYISERLGFITSFIFALIIFLIITTVSVIMGWFIPLIIFVAIGITTCRIMKPKLFRRLSISVIKRSLMTVRTVQSYFNTAPQKMENYPKEAIRIQ